MVAADGYNFKTYIVMEYCHKGTLEQHRCEHGDSFLHRQTSQIWACEMPQARNNDPSCCMSETGYYTIMPTNILGLDIHCPGRTLCGQCSHHALVCREGNPHQSWSCRCSFPLQNPRCLRISIRIPLACAGKRGGRCCDRTIRGAWCGCCVACWRSCMAWSTCTRSPSCMGT